MTLMDCLLAGQEKLLRDVIDVVEDMGIQLDNLVQASI